MTNVFDDWIASLRLGRFGISNYPEIRGYDSKIRDYVLAPFIECDPGAFRRDVRARLEVINQTVCSLTGLKELDDDSTLILYFSIRRYFKNNAGKSRKSFRGARGT